MYHRQDRSIVDEMPGFDKLRVHSLVLPPSDMRPLQWGRFMAD